MIITDNPCAREQASPSDYEQPYSAWPQGLKQSEPMLREAAEPPYFISNPVNNQVFLTN
jgi:hypothetical protein